MMSVLIVTVAAPVLFARDPVANRGLRRTLVFLVAFDVLYVAYITLVHTAYYKPPAWNW